MSSSASVSMAICSLRSTAECMISRSLRENILPALTTLHANESLLMRYRSCPLVQVERCLGSWLNSVRST